MTKVLIKASATDKGLITISDNQGNSFKQQGGFMNVSCSGKEQDINAGAIAGVAGMLGYHFGTQKAAMEKSLLNPVKDAVEDTMTKVKRVARDLPSLGKDSPLPRMMEGVFSGLANLENVEMQVTLKDNLPSPLTGLCVDAQKSGFIRNK